MIQIFLKRIPNLVGSGKFLWLRIAFTIIQVVHIVCEIVSNFSIENKPLYRVNIALLYFNLVNLPFHTILTTSSIRPDLLYLTHLYGNGVIFLLKVMEYAERKNLGDSFCFVIFGATHFIFHVPTNLLYLKTFEACAEMCWICPESHQMIKVDPDAIVIRLMKPWLALFALRVVMVLFRSIVAAATNKADYWWGLNAGTLVIQNAFYSMLLLFEIHMYIQINPKKSSSSWYLLTSANKIEMMYLVFIISLGVLALVCFVLAFCDHPNALLESIKYLGNAILITRWILLWYYAKDEMDHHRLSENLGNLRISKMGEMKKASTGKSDHDYSNDSEGLYEDLEGIEAKLEGEETTSGCQSD